MIKRQKEPVPLLINLTILFLTFDDRRCRIVYNNKDDRIHFEIRIKKSEAGETVMKTISVQEITAVTGSCAWM